MRCYSDFDRDGELEAFVAGFGAPNIIWKWDKEQQKYMDIAYTLAGASVVRDSGRKAIGVAACDVDGDGFEE